MSEPQTPSPPPTPPASPQPEKKKGLHPMAWVAIGCGVILLIGVIMVTAGGLFVAKKAKDFIEDAEENPVAMAAETMVKLNPDLELVESDREGGLITVREKSTGKVVTFNYEDIESGQFSFETDDGETASFDLTEAGSGDGSLLTVTTEEGTSSWGASGEAVDLPDWLPAYSGSATGIGGFSTSTSTSRSGTYVFQTDDAPDDVLAFYEAIMEDLEMEVSRTSYSGGGASVVSISGQGEGRSLTATVTSSDEGRQVNVGYEGPA